MSMVADKEVKRILKYRRKLGAFSIKLYNLYIKAPNKSIKGKLRETLVQCENSMDSLMACKMLKSQIGEKNDHST